MAVKQSFAESVLAGFKIEVEENGSVLIDATDFFLADAFGVIQQLTATKQGAYKIDKDRSAIVLDNTKNFPLNTEVESMLTFVTDKPADKSLVATVAPDAYSVTLREHFSFVQLPEAGYTPRAFDPRSGYFDVMYRDYSAPLGSPHRSAIHLAPSLAEERPFGCRERGGEAHRVLRGSRCARAHSHCAGGRRKLVGAGIRGGGLQECVPRRGAARRRRSHGRALQHHPVGASLDARMVVRRRHDRSAHRRDHQGAGHAGFAARASGLPDRRGAAVSVQEGRAGFAAIAGDGAGAHSPARRPRSRTHAGLGAQLRRQRDCARHFGDGLPAPVDHARRQWPSRSLARLLRWNWCVGQSLHPVRLFAIRTRRRRACRARTRS